MNPDPEAVRELVTRLLAEKAAGRSFRTQAKDYPSIITYGTLSNLTRGILPKDRKILKALGLVRQGREWLPGEWRMKRKIGKMAKETAEKVLATK